MGDQKWLEGWSGRSTDELLALEGAYRTDSLVLAFEMAPHLKLQRFPISEAARGLRQRCIPAPRDD